MRGDFRERVLDILYPLGRITLAVLCVIQRNNLVFEHRVNRGRIKLVLICLVGEGPLVGQGPACTFAITFIPPSVENREVEDTVHLGFFARRAGSFQRAGRGIQPNIHAGNQTFCQSHVIILEEYDFAEEFGTTRNLNDILYQFLAACIGRMGFSGKDELYGILGIVYNLGQTFQVGKQKVCTFISRETAAESYGERIGIDAGNHHKTTEPIYKQKAEGIKYPLLQLFYLKYILECLDKLFHGCRGIRVLQQYLP